MWVIKEFTLENVPEGDNEEPDLTLSPMVNFKTKMWRRISLERSSVRPLLERSSESPLSPLNKEWDYHLLPLRRVFGEANWVAAQEFSTVKEAQRAGAWFQPWESRTWEAVWLAALMTRGWRNMAATLGLAYPSQSVEAKTMRCFHGPIVVRRQEWATPGLVLGLDLYGCLRGNMTSWGRIGGGPLGSQGLRQCKRWGPWRASNNALSGLEKRPTYHTISHTKGFLSPLLSFHLQPQESMVKRKILTCAS